MNSDATEGKYIVFKILNYPLALPIDIVLKVITCPPHVSQMLQDVWLAQMGQRTLMILNLHQTLKPDYASNPVYLDNFGRFLLIIRGSQGELCGIPIDEPPNLQEIPATLIQSVPQSYYLAGLPTWVNQIAIFPSTSSLGTILMLNIKQALAAKAKFFSEKTMNKLKAIANSGSGLKV